LLVGTVVQDHGDFRFRGRPEGREGRRCGGRGTECGDSAEELADKARRCLYIFFGEEGGKAVSKWLAEVQEGKGEDDLRCSRLLIVWYSTSAKII